MQDSLFSPRRETASQMPPEQVQGVTAIVGYIKRIISGHKTLASLRVRGEVSGLANRSGRLYFKLKENADVLECIAWANDASKLSAL